MKEQKVLPTRSMSCSPGYPKYYKPVNFFGLVIPYSPCNLHFYGYPQSPLGVVNLYEIPKKQYRIKKKQ